MFTKYKHEGRVTVNKYRKVIDWDAVWTTIIIGGIAILVLASL